MIQIYDTHAHLDYPQFESDMIGTLKRAEAAGVTRIISIGTDLESSARAVNLAEKHPSIYAVAGWHPSNVMEAPDDIRDALRKFADHPKVVALGETGLDYSRLPGKEGGSDLDDARYKEKQKQIFLQHLEVAREKGLNCVVHQREAMDDTLAIFTPFASVVRTVFHCFVDDFDRARKILELGSLVSFTGIVTFKNAQTVKDTAKATSLGSFMVETDCPYLAPAPHRGKPCEPAYTALTAQHIAELKGCTLEEVAKGTCEAAHSFFPKMIRQVF
ncbi:MAG: TatD family hydrolase [Verrucomicrobiales bacterium]